MATATANDVSLADFDDDFPSAKREGYKSGDFELKELKDGEYLFQVDSAEVKNGKMFKLSLELLTECPQAGGKIEKCYFFTKKNKDSGLEEKNADQLAQVKEDLGKLGFDTENWTKENSRPFSVELPKVPEIIKGMRVVCNKKTGGKKNANEYYHNLYIVNRGDGDGKPEKIGAKELEDANFDPLA